MTPHETGSTATPGDSRATVPSAYSATCGLNLTMPRGVLAGARARPDETKPPAVFFRCASAPSCHAVTRSWPYGPATATRMPSTLGCQSRR